MGYKSFEEMPLWQEAHGLAVEVHEVTATFPRHEMYGLTSQLRRAAILIKSSPAIVGSIADASHNTFVRLM